MIVRLKAALCNGGIGVSINITDPKDRISRAFSARSTTDSMTCEACGKTYFLTGPMAGAYAEGELESLLESAENHPEDYKEVCGRIAIDYMEHPIDGRVLVVGCECDPTNGLTTWIESHSEELTTYLGLYWKAMRATAEGEVDRAAHYQEMLAWQPMETAPRDGAWIIVETEGMECLARWVTNGWFIGYPSLEKISPIHWRPEKVL